MRGDCDLEDLFPHLGAVIVVAQTSPEELSEGHSFPSNSPVSLNKVREQNDPAKGEETVATNFRRREAVKLAGTGALMMSTSATATIGLSTSATKASAQPGGEDAAQA